MTPSAYLSRKVPRLRHQCQTAPNFARVIALSIAQVRLADHVRARVAPSFTDTIWRPKRDGGPYRLDPGLRIERAA